MEQSGLRKNFTGTILMLSLAVSMNLNSTQTISSLSAIPFANYSFLNERSYNATAHLLENNGNKVNNVYVGKKRNHLQEESERLFGQMRSATAQESASVNNYIRSISKDTGVSFYNLC